MKVSERIKIDIRKEMRSRFSIESLIAGRAVESDGHLIWGPYLTLSPGDWVVQLEAEIDAAEGCVLEVFSSMGRVRHARGSCSPSGCSVSFRLTHSTDHIELCLFAKAGSRVRIKEIIFSRVADIAWELHRPMEIQRKFEIHERLGLRLILDESSLVDRSLIRLGQWEQDRLKQLTDAAIDNSINDRKKIFLDIGSYFGLYAMVMHSIQVFDKIVAFEPDRFNHKQLIANLLLNDPDNWIEVHNIAASDKVGKLSFTSAMSGRSYNRGGSAIGSVGGFDSYSVDSAPVDSLVSDSGAIVFAKIDVEGHELQVLKGMEKIITNNQCYLQVERFESIDLLNKFFADRGYRFLGTIQSDHYYTNLPMTHLDGQTAEPRRSGIKGRAKKLLRRIDASGAVARRA